MFHYLKSTFTLQFVYDFHVIIKQLTCVGLVLLSLSTDFWDSNLTSACSGELPDDDWSWGLLDDRPLPEVQLPSTHYVSSASKLVFLTSLQYQLDIDIQSSSFKKNLKNGFFQSHFPALSIIIISCMHHSGHCASVETLNLCHTS